MRASGDPRVVVVGLGPAGPDLLTVAARQVLDEAPACFLRTTRHPAAAGLDAATSFDHHYQDLDDLDSVYAAIVEDLVAAAGRDGRVVYAVPGSPTVAERTVALLAADDRVEVELVAGMSFLELAWTRLGIDPLVEGVRLVDGHRFAVEAAGERGPLLVGQVDSAEVLSDVKLVLEEVEGAGPGAVTVLHHLGLADESVAAVPTAELDRIPADHLTALYVPALAAPVAREVAQFVELVRTLRHSCPWDREQTHATLVRHLVEETYEVIEAIEALGPGAGVLGASGAEVDPDAYQHLAEELGDLLFQVVFHARLGAEVGAFTMADVATAIHDKLVGRHPHVFAGVEASTPGQVVTNWEQIKRGERGSSSLMASVPRNLPSTLYAYKVQRKAASVGLDPVPDPPGLTPELGELLFAGVAACRRAGLDPETELRVAARRFQDRFCAVEQVLAARGREVAEVSDGELAEVWDQVGRDG